MSRPYTKDEVRQEFLDHIRGMIRYWDSDVVSGSKTRADRLEGLAFSILVMLDGESSLPGFRVIADPHPDDMQYHIDEGENYYPEGVDIAGGLHRRLVAVHANGGAK